MRGLMGLKVPELVTNWLAWQLIFSYLQRHRFFVKIKRHKFLKAEGFLYTNGSD